MGTTTQNITQTTSNIGAAQQPYYNAAMQGAAGLLTAPTQRYVSTHKDPVTGVVTETPIGRIAGFTEQQKNLQNEVAGLQTPGQFGQATNFANQAGLGALNAANYTPGQFNVQQVQNPNLNMYQMGAAQQFGNEQAQQYMSPYFQNVLDIQKREALKDAQQSQLMQNLGAARQGTYGGSRQLLAGLTRERDLGQQMGDIQAKGLQSAYENAQNQFERDRAAGFSVNDANLRAALGVQELGARNSLQAALANQQYGLEGQRLGEQSRQFGAEQGLKGYETAGNMAQTLANIGQVQQQANAQRLGLQQSTAAQEQALNQQKLDTAYADWQKETNDPYTRIQQYMNILSGVPQATTSTSTTSAPAPGLAQTLAGAGLGAYSTYKMFGG
jgi:hypothetical protein